MGWLRKARYDRREALAKAAEEAAHGRTRRAIALYRRVLVAEPANLEVHGAIAPLLAERGEVFDAWVSFRTVALAHERSRAYEKALSIYREAAERLPERIEIWLAVARVERRLGRPRNALRALSAGRRHQRKRSQRPAALYLLREALDHAPWQPELVFDLADVLARSGRKEEASLWLEGLAQRCPQSQRKRVQGARLRVAPSLANAWRWLRA